MNKAQNECTCPSGDGSLRWPCPAHPAVEQAGGDERAAFELFVRKHCGMPAHIAVNWDAKFTNDAWEGWKARAALAQPYPPPHPAPDLDFSRPLETENGDPVKWICADVIEYKSARVCVAKDTGLVYSSPYIGLKIRNVMPEQAEAERPEVAGYRSKESGMVYEQDYGLNNPEALTTVAECERIVGALRAVITQLRQHKNDYMDAGQETYRALQNEIREREAEIARLDGLVSSRTTERDAALARVAELKTMSHNYCALLMDANAKLAELEKQEPINLQHMAVAADGELRWMTGRKIDNCELYAMPDFGQAPKLYAAPVVQAQQLNDLDKQCRDDVARALGLRPNQERGFAWSYLLASIKSCVKASGDSAQAQHSAGYAEARQCVNCRHIGINDAADYAACHDCRWTGPEPDEDKCPGCAGENCMAAACPECGGRYELVAEAKISTPAAQAGQMPQAWLDVQAERRRQITAEGWTPEHDDEHSHGQIARAAACYALAGSSAPNDGTAALLVSLAWPWDEQWWKPTTVRRDMVKACALALAEIERLDRAAPGKEGV
ncbi:TPA: coiled-coil domain-containing protein [Pseudomonas aeruginosa]|uniref:coiled-coil domain-containing protein n=1 Tax=Pseudomonas aeruginosa TaxID=287 RepID=UPI000AD60789|nr:coiled-coil domain-containing protein [Pseudomonas aeruginosa]